jgi:hypothetical protein
MSTHRHRGFDLLFITQWPSKLHHQIRTLCGKHVHMNRPMGMQRAGVLTWPRVQSDPYDEKQRESAEEEIWPYPKALYSKYTSATLHTVTHKFKIPGKVWSALSVTVVLGLIVGGVYLYVAKAQVKATGTKPAPVSSAEGPQVQAPMGAHAAPVVEKDVDISTVGGYQRAMQPVIESMPWTAPAFSGREIVSEPRVFCSASEAGLDANGEMQEASCTCLTEQSTEYRMSPLACRYLARHGEAYNPFRRVVERESRGAGGTPADIGPSGPAPALEAARGSGSADAQQAAYGQYRDKG